MKTTGSVVKEVEGKGAADKSPLTVSKRLRSELKANDAALDVPGLSERHRNVCDVLYEERELKEVARANPERLRRSEVVLENGERGGGPGSEPEAPSVGSD